MVVYGDIGAGDEPWEAVTEPSALRPANLYGLTEVLSEDIARYHATAGAIRTVALRLGMFVPETFERYGLRLLFGGVDDRDVAQSWCGRSTTDRRTDSRRSTSWPTAA